MPEITTASDQLPLLEDTESKSASDLELSEPNVAVGPEELPLLEDIGAKNASELTMTEAIEAPSERFHDRIEFENPPNPYATE